jgi:hypothetical protein
MHSRRLGTALTILFGAALTPFGMGPQVNFNPRIRRAMPFSSDRQHLRTARTQINVKMPNGHTVMQTLPSYLRRNDVEAGMVLSGKLKIGTVA